MLSHHSSKERNINSFINSRHCFSAASYRSDLSFFSFIVSFSSMRQLLLVAALFFSSWNEHSTNAFVLPTQNEGGSSRYHPHQSSSASTTILGATYDPYDHSSNSDQGGWNRNNNQKARTDVRNFLTQRSIQSFVFVLNQCKEGHTVRWLENKLDFKKIDSYHGTGAFNATLFPEWDSLFLDLATQDPEQVIIEVTQKKTKRGWGHQASYVDSINNNNSPEPPPAAAPPAPWMTNYRPQAAGPPGNYLAKASWKKAPSVDDAAASTNNHKKIVPRASGVPGNYLEALSSSPQQQQEPETLEKEDKKPKQEQRHKKKKKKKTGRKTRKERELSIEMKTKPAEPEEMPEAVASSSNRAGSHGGYLETLLSNTIESSSSEPSAERAENPHMDEKTFEFEFDIDPPSLVTRIISVREQISKEWKEDLDTVVRTNDRILDDYEENQRKTEEATLNDDDDDDNDDEEEEDMVAPYQEASQEEGKTLLFDRNMMSYLTNSIASQDRASSPLRRANLDLLLVLCTQESVHRVLKEYQEDKEDDMHMEKYEWLQSFYKTNVKEYFDGHEHSFGRADNFLETLMAQSAVAREKRNGGIYLINPISITEDILRERSMVAREWKSIIATIPDEHLDLRRILFSRHLMEATDWKIGGIGSNSLHIEESPLMEATPESGAFE